MGKHYLYRLLFATAFIFVSGCSTEKNTTVSRAYHNLTAHYNVYYNGRESLRSGVEKINNSIDDDYSKILPLFKSSDPSTAKTATSDMENAIIKASKLIQSHSITKKPKRRKNRSKSYLNFVGREEFNNWVDDAYLLMGQAYFYQHNFTSAISNFTFLTRKFSDTPSLYDAYVWLIRSYTEMERYVEAYELIQQMHADQKFPRRLVGELAEATADYHARQKAYVDGIPFLTTAAKYAKSKTERLRYLYILAQWNNEINNPDKASLLFREVARRNPPYTMAFNASINAAGTFTGKGDPEKLKKELRRMLRDKKNLEFRDQIYFAMGNISMKEGNKEQALKEYAKSASASSENLHQRSLSCLTLAQIYFDEREYKKAQSYYDSAMVVIDEQYVGYKQIAERHKNLTRLTDNIYTVEREDSLQRLAQMDEPKRNALIDKWIKAEADKEAQARAAQSAQVMDRNYFRANESRFGLSQQQEGGGWYFYNPTTVAYGKVEFERLWGKRKLEDGWRRADKRVAGEENQEQAEDSVLVAKKVEKKFTDPKTRDFYTQDLPLNDTLMKESHTKIRNALFNEGRIFRTEFSDFPRSIEAYENLNQRYPDNVFTLASWFELWDLYTKQNNSEKAEYYKNLVISKYPGTKYANYLLNPNYFIELEAKSDSINQQYKKAFEKFKEGNYNEAGKITTQVLTMKPDSVLVPKIMFIKAVADGTAANRETFGKILTEYVTAYPKAEPKPLAEKILNLIKESSLEDYQQMVASGYLNEQISNSELLPNKERGTDEFGGKFSYDEDLLHYFVIAYPKNANIDLNRLKFDLANYNIDHYTKTDFDIETQNLENSSILLVRSLNNKEQGLIYFRSIIKKREVFETLKNIKYVNFIASSTNFREITADKDYTEYLKFFIKNYSRFITGDFSEEALPSPEELIAKAQQEEYQPKEKGSFVEVAPTGQGTDIYSDVETGAQNFVIAVNTPKANLKPLIASFDAYNREQFKAANLSVTQTQVADYQLITVGKFNTKDDAINYFTQSLVNRKLFKSLDTLSYRNFIITDANMKKLATTKKVQEYVNFFKIKYINQSDEPKGKTNVPETGNVEQQGPYKMKADGAQSYVLIIPQDEVNREKLIEAIGQFNTKNYAGQPLVVSASMLDDFRLMIKVEGFANKQTALGYLRTIANDTQVYGPIKDANYRNFVISPENETIFRRDRNILIYMEFYKQHYLK